MKIIRSILETIALFIVCTLAFLAAIFILPLLTQGSSDGFLATIWNLLMANAIFFGLPYWHLTEAKDDGFLPNASSYSLILILAVFGVVSIFLSFSVDIEWWETLYTFAQSAGAIFVAYLAIQHRKPAAEES